MCLAAYRTFIVADVPAALDHVRDPTLPDGLGSPAPLAVQLFTTAQVVSGQ